MFYTDKLATTQIDVYSRSNQYEFLDYDDQMAGKTVALESSNGAHSVALVGENDFFTFDYYENYLPVRRMTAQFMDFPIKLIARDSTTLKVKLTNPYPYNIIIGNEKTNAQVHFVLKQNRKIVYDVVPEIISATIKGHSSIFIEMKIEAPEIEGVFDAYICIQQPDLSYAPNNAVPKKVKISNQTPWL
jgi:hypothetical protein